MRQLIMRDNLRTFTQYSVLIAGLVLGVTLFSVAPSIANADTLDFPGQVSDGTTNVSIAKLDMDTHEPVADAKMLIKNKETEEVVDEWVSGSSPHQTTKTLDVNTHYILEEVSAPNGYQIAEQTEFYINEVRGEGFVIVSGANAERTDEYSMALYDKALSKENIVTVTKTREGNKEATTKIEAPKTGDDTPVPLVIALVTLGVIAVGVLQIVKRYIKKSDSAS